MTDHAYCKKYCKQWSISGMAKHMKVEEMRHISSEGGVGPGVKLVDDYDLSG